MTKILLDYDTKRYIMKSLRPHERLQMGLKTKVPDQIVKVFVYFKSGERCWLKIKFIYEKGLVGLYKEFYEKTNFTDMIAIVTNILSEDRIDAYAFEFQHILKDPKELKHQLNSYLSFLGSKNDTAESRKEVVQKDIEYRDILKTFN